MTRCATNPAGGSLSIEPALPDPWLKLYKGIQSDFTEFTESLAAPRH